ncbi:uncharacterized protein LOC130993003 [Salvia miltiorrhiza]|uniref:uncharacterized protein LOC130993003 n=1 Tax=Salvia miltiorrhiza TaxID=226208 RepID=UPI0025AB963C|nr:uncharacterized protein LOC130993003 [Salvia miltiorrhiza]
MTDVVRTTILSKCWKNLWTAAHYLNFDNYDMMFIHSTQLENFVNRVLLRWNGVRVLKFKVESYFEFHDSVYADAKLWVHFAKHNLAEELYLHMGLYIEDDFMCRHGWVSPQCLYSCSSLKVLSVENCYFSINGNVQWNQLKSLTITEGIGLTEDAINRILCGSPQLEVLGAMIEGCMNSSSPNGKLLQFRFYCNKVVVTIEIFPLSKKLVIKVERRRYEDSIWAEPNIYREFEENLPMAFVLQLMTVEYILVEGDIIFPCLEFLLKNASSLEKIVFRVKRSVQHSQSLESLFHASRELLKMPRSSRTAEFSFNEY